MDLTQINREENISGRLEKYFKSNDWAAEAKAFESRIESMIFDQLESKWQNGWDFDTQTEYFGGRGASLLIQNTEIDYESIWTRLVHHCATLPAGALINFEVFDSIQEDLMVGGDMVIHRIITSIGAFEEEHSPS